MSWGPVRSISYGGVAFALLVILTGLFIFAWSQGWLPFKLDIWSFCALSLIVLGVIILGGVLWGRRMAAGRWRRWAQDWEQGWQRPPTPPPQP